MIHDWTPNLLKFSDFFTQHLQPLILQFDKTNINMHNGFEFKSMTNQMLPELKDLHFSAFGYDPLFNTDYYNDIMKGETPILLLFDKEISKMVGFSVIDETKCYIMAFGIHHSYRRRGLGCYL
eukprot:399803_1